MSTYSQAHFLSSAWQPRQFVADEGLEVAFAGRSNAGKSTAINAITGRNGLARTSKTPGQTQLVNFFELAPGQRLVDLPGYGYAKVPVKIQRHWRQLMTAYFERRASLAGVFLIMDARRPLLEFDQQMLAWTGTATDRRLRKRPAVRSAGQAGHRRGPWRARGDVRAGVAAGRRAPRGQKKPR